MVYGHNQARIEENLARAGRNLFWVQTYAAELGDNGLCEDVYALQREVTRLLNDQLKRGSTRGARLSQ